MNPDFDRLLDRRGTASLKWDFQERFAGTDGLLPLWVADMDFPSPPEVIGALQRRAEHGVFGYTLEPESWFEAAAAWIQARHGWRVEREWLLPCPGVVPAIKLAIQAFSEPGDGVVIQPPVYHPFRESVRRNRRRLVENPLRLEGTRYSPDVAGLEGAADERTRLLILCSPHNPVARVWDRSELERLAEACLARRILIVSDEIHCDLIMPGFRHLPTASLSEEIAGRTVTLLSATKTFNLAGLGGSLAVVPDRGLRERFRRAGKALWTEIANAFAVAASEAAWRHGAPWLDAVLAYVEANYRFLVELLARRLPAAVVFPLEGTYLAWIDFRPLGLSDAQLRERILRQARVWLDDGPMFGTGGAGFQRVNLACPRAILEEALERMVRALA